jgi:hypothetical protein
VGATEENPSWAPFLKGEKADTLAALLVARAVLKPLQAFTSPPFDKGGQGDFKKGPIGKKLTTTIVD